MELNTEINKVFGIEMAKIFVSTISEEEMKEKAEKVWKDLQFSTDRWGNRTDSSIEKIIKQTILERIHEKILEILKEPINDELLEKKAREMVQEARKVGEEMIIKQMAKNIAEHAYHGFNECSDDTIRIIMNNVHAEMASNGITRGW